VRMCWLRAFPTLSVFTTRLMISKRPPQTPKKPSGAMNCSVDYGLLWQ
jgi:hypothetical protein